MRVVAFASILILASKYVTKFFSIVTWDPLRVVCDGVGRPWFKSRVGIQASETPRADAFCAHAILQDEPLLVPDARRDPRLAHNRLVAGAPDIRFYAGVQVRSSGCLALGALCAIDVVPLPSSA